MGKGVPWQAFTTGAAFNFAQGVFEMWFGKSRRMKKVAKKWHAVISQKAREPAPYAAGMVEDTTEGRFSMMTVVTTCVLRRLRTLEPDGRELADAVYRDVFASFDYALREEGVGDSSIARKVRKMGEAFFGLARAMDADFERADGASQLPDILTRNGVTREPHSERLAAWVTGIDATLQGAPDERVRNADITL